MVNKDFFKALEDLENEKNISKESFIEILESALTSAYKKHFGEAKSAYVKILPEKNTIKVYAYKTVVEEVEDADKQISLADAKELSSRHKVGDIITDEVTPKEFGRIAAQTAKHIIVQRLQEKEKEIILKEINGKESEIVTGVVRKIDNKNIMIELAGTTISAQLGEFDQIAGEKFSVNDKIKVYVKQIKDTPFGPQIVVSRKHPNYVRKLIEMEVPEISSGEVVIKSIARDAGKRTKIAVYSANPNLDSVGACIGNKGARINTIMAELNGEKIDIIEFSEDPFVFIARALAPAQVRSVELNNDTEEATVLVPKDKLSLAIGKGGQNVRLAAKLTGWKLDVLPMEDEENEKDALAVEEEGVVDENKFDILEDDSILNTDNADVEKVEQNADIEKNIETSDDDKFDILEMDELND